MKDTKRIRQYVTRYAFYCPDGVPVHVKLGNSFIAGRLHPTDVGPESSTVYADDDGEAMFIANDLILPRSEGNGLVAEQQAKRKRRHRLLRTRRALSSENMCELYRKKTREFLEIVDNKHRRGPFTDEEVERRDKICNALSLLSKMYYRRYGYVLDSEARRDQMDYQQKQRAIADGWMAPDEEVTT